MSVRYRTTPPLKPHSGWPLPTWHGCRSSCFILHWQVPSATYLEATVVSMTKKAAMTSWHQQPAYHGFGIRGIVKNLLAVSELLVLPVHNQYKDSRTLHLVNHSLVGLHDGVQSLCLGHGKQRADRRRPARRTKHSPPSPSGGLC